MSVRILTGDCRELLKTLPDESVHSVVTSPPYFGLRDYGVAGQIGLEPTPDAFVAEMVAVFREVRRILRKDGTVFLNLGDSYATGAGSGRSMGGKVFGKQNEVIDQGSYPVCQPNRMPLPGLKPKDLIGIPWAVAKALRDPYYTGKIKSERDRVWIAAMLDAEGTICGFRHERPDGAKRTGTLVFITNSSQPILDECDRIWPGARYLEHTKAGDEVMGATATRDCWRWQIQQAEDRLLFLREVYPYLIEKKRQCLVAYNLTQFAVDAKKHGRGGDSDDTKGKRQVLAQLLTDLNQRRHVDLPVWLKAPPSTTEPGWYLRQDIIWAKNNPMPESVTDRCTKAHEYIFMLTKSATYFYDAEAIAEPVARLWDETNGGSWAHKERFPRGTAQGEHSGAYPLPNANGTRNRRSVWTVATQPFSEAHFATFPPALIEPCILAGCPAKCCAKCGAPWVRLTDGASYYEGDDGSRDRKTNAVGNGHGGGGRGPKNNLGASIAKTLGFSPSCACNAAMVPGTCLDPFGGRRHNWPRRRSPPAQCDPDRTQSRLCRHG